MFTTVARFADPLEAHIACGRLRAEGIDAHVADAHMGLANWEWRLAVGGTRVLVDESDADFAHKVIRDLDAGAYALDSDASSGATLQAPDRESWSSRLAWIALMLFNVPLPWRRRPPRDDEAVREV
ncbi:putative signal transducing protein [Pseudoluteimonas lycopersici]|nr:DUF2007 domain-containing protein [Lysobacter lycopersici]